MENQRNNYFYTEIRAENQGDNFYRNPIPGLWDEPERVIEPIENCTVGDEDITVNNCTFDKKQYRQIIIKKNGLRVVLISDTEAMIHQEHFEYESESEDEDDEKMNASNDDEEDDDDDESFEDDGIRKAAAAIIVGAGSYHDPECAQGMAHFLEVSLQNSCRIRA